MVYAASWCLVSGDHSLSTRLSCFEDVGLLHASLESCYRLVDDFGACSLDYPAATLVVEKRRCFPEREGHEKVLFGLREPFPAFGIDRDRLAAGENSPAAAADRDASE